MAQQSWMMKHGHRDSDGGFIQLKRAQFYKLSAKDMSDLEAIRAAHLIPHVNAAPWVYRHLISEVLDNPKYSRTLRLDIAYTMPRREEIIDWGWKNYGRKALLALNDIRPLSPEQGKILGQNKHVTTNLMREIFIDKWVSRWAQDNVLHTYAQRTGYDLDLISEVSEFIDLTELDRTVFFAKAREVLNLDDGIPDNWIKQMVKL